MKAATLEQAVEPVNATVNEAAAYLNVSATTIWRGIYSGRIKSVRFGRCVRIPWDEAERLSRDGFDAE